MSPYLRFEGSDDVSVYRTNEHVVLAGQPVEVSEVEASRLLSDFPDMFVLMADPETGEVPIIDANPVSEGVTETPEDEPKAADGDELQALVDEALEAEEIHVTEAYSLIAGTFVDDSGDEPVIVDPTTAEHTYGATATVDDVDLVFDMTDEVWVTAETHEAWTGGTPKEDEPEKDLVYEGPTEPVTEGEDPTSEIVLPTIDELMVLRKEDLQAKCTELGIEPIGNKATMAAAILASLAEAKEDAAE